MNTATGIARHAVEVAGKLSPSMEAELLEATERDGALRIPGRHRMSTEGALTRRGLIEPGTTVVTNFGRVVRVVLLKGADEVVAAAARKDAERDERNHQHGDHATCATEGHDARPAVAILVYIGQGEALGDYLCRECATCSEPDCELLGEILDAEYEEPWCRRHADQFGPGEAVSGPDIVPIGSERHRTLDTGDDTDSDLIPGLQR
jgi:hypothetical protein